MKSQYNPLEPVAKARVATAMAASLSFCSERKYLEGITKEDAPFILRATSRTSQLDVKWIAVTQVGKPLEKSAENLNNNNTTTNTFNQEKTDVVEVKAENKLNENKTQKNNKINADNLIVKADKTLARNDDFSLNEDYKEIA